MPTYVAGLHELQSALAKADREVRLGVRGSLRQVAEPVRAGAEQLALANISGMARSPRWSKMRVGITRDLVYVAPRQRGSKGRIGDPRRRGRQFADLLMDRAMQPALERHAGEIEHRMEELLDHVADDFNHGGGVMAQITVNARQYDLATLDDLTLDEAMIVWDYTKLSLDQVPDLEGFHPGLIKALLHISVARGEPGESSRSIRDAVGQLKVAELNTVFMEISEEVDELPAQRARAQLATQRFWRGFLIHWGAAPGTQPGKRYWQPWLGHWCSLRPEDLGAMTPHQLEACYGWVTKAQE